MESNNMKLESIDANVTNQSQPQETTQLVDSNSIISANQLTSSDIQLVQNNTNNQNSQWNNQLQMMFLSSGSNLLNNNNLIAVQDGHLLVTPISEGGQQDPNLLAQQLLLQQQLQQQNTLVTQKNDNEQSTILESQASLTQPQKTEKPKLPKKPLNTYMMFSKAIWPQVKAANSHLSSVTEIGAIVGAIWRDLDASQKQQYNEYFIKDKERYENELREYRQMTGLSETDSIRPPNKKRCKDSRTTSTTWQMSTTQNTVTTQEAMKTVADSLTSDQMITQQVLAGLSSNGQLLLNNDNNIDNNLVNIFNQNSQGLITQNNISGEKQVDSLVSNLITNDQNTWLWSQQNKLDNSLDLNSLQNTNNITSDIFKDGGTTLYYDEQQKQFYLKNENGVSALITGIDPTTGMITLDPTATPVLSREQLEAELQQLRSALSERTSQVQLLSTRLEEAKQIIEHYQQQMQQLTSRDDEVVASTTEEFNGVLNDDNKSPCTTTTSAN